MAKIPVQDLERARGFYRETLGLEPVEERENGLRYCCAAGEFHLFVSSGRSSGTATQLGFEVEDLDAVMTELAGRGVIFEGDVVQVRDNYPSRGTGERGAFFRDSEGNVVALGQATP